MDNAFHHSAALLAETQMYVDAMPPDSADAALLAVLDTQWLLEVARDAARGMLEKLAPGSTRVIAEQAASLYTQKR